MGQDSELEALRAVTIGLVYMQIHVYEVWKKRRARVYR